MVTFHWFGIVFLGMIFLLPLLLGYLIGHWVGYRRGRRAGAGGERGFPVIPLEPPGERK